MHQTPIVPWVILILALVLTNYTKLTGDQHALHWSNVSSATLKGGSILNCKQPWKLEKEMKERVSGVTSFVNGVGSMGGVFSGPIIGWLWGVVDWGGVLSTVVIVTIIGAFLATTSG